MREDHLLNDDVLSGKLNSAFSAATTAIALQSLSNVIGPFICSGSHVIQKDCHPSALSTFVDAVFQCGPPSITLKPCIIKYVGKSHNLWHRALLVLEQTAAETSPLFRPRSVVAAAATAAAEYDFDAASISPPVCISVCLFFKPHRMHEIWTIAVADQ